MAEEKWVTWDGLKYYDSKVKSHIDSKLSELQSNVPSEQEFNELKERVEDIANEQSRTSAKVDSFQDHIDENEAAIENLRTFALQVTSDISALQTHMQYTVKKEDLNSYATEEFVADAIRSAQISGDIDLSDYYKKGDVNALVGKVQGDIDVAETKINGLSNKLNDVSLDVETNHNSIEQLLVSVENKADEEHYHHLSDIIDYEEPDLTNYATKDDVRDAIDNLLIPDFDNYYTKPEIDRMIPELDNLVTKQELDVLTNAVSDVEETLEEKADKLYVKEEIEKAALSGKVDLTDYYTKELIDLKFDTVNQQIEHSSDKIDELVRLGVSHESRLDSLSSELENKASREYVDNKISTINIPSKTSDLVNDSGYITAADIPDTSRFATIEDITQLTQELENNYVTTETLQNNYVSNTYITENYITTQELEATYVTNEKVTEVVNNEVNTVVAQELETIVADVIDQKVDSGEIAVATDKITYGDFEDDI